MAFQLIDRIKQHADASPIAPALMSMGGGMSYGLLFDDICKVANYFDNLRLPRLGRALLNIAHPDLRLIVFMAAIDYGLIPLVAQPDTVRADFGWDFVIGSLEPVWRDVPADVMVTQAVFAGEFADARRRLFPERGDNDLSYIAETSGTTGRPKLVAITHKSHREFYRLRDRRRFTREDRVISSTGGTNKYGIRVSVAALYDGAASVTMILDLSTALKLINLFNATYFLTTPAYIERLIDFMEMKNIRCPSVREIQLTGAAFDADLLRRIESRFTARIFVGYGTSEIESGGVARGEVSSASYIKGYVGRINPELKVIVTGTKAKPGPIVIVNDRDQFVRSIVHGKIVQYDQPFYTVPDIGYVEDSILYVAGRSDEVFNNSGNIKAYSLMEEEIRRQGRVKDVGIVSAASLGGDKDIIIGVVADRPLDLTELARGLAEGLLMVGAEKHFKFCQLPEIKRNQQTGKLDRVALIRDYQDRNRNAASPDAKVATSVEEESIARG